MVEILIPNVVGGLIACAIWDGFKAILRVMR